MLGNLSPSQALGAASAREGAKENSSFPSTGSQGPGGGATSCFTSCGPYSLKTATGHKEMDIFFFFKYGVWKPYVLKQHFPNIIGIYQLPLRRMRYSACFPCQLSILLLFLQHVCV